jgi:sensor domain CHASE-containing protein
MDEYEKKLKQDIHDSAEAIAKSLENDSDPDLKARQILAERLNFAHGMAQELLALKAGNQPQNKHRI